MKKGDVLVKLDASAEQAQLRAAQADAELAKADFERASDLAVRKVISEAEFDAAQSKFTAEDRRRSKTCNRSSTKRRSARRSMASPASATSTRGRWFNVGHALVSLQALDQVFVDFSLPQQQLAEVKPDLPVKVTTDAIPGREFEGKLTAINSAIDPVTRNVSLQATVDNADHALRAGMFGRVESAPAGNKPTLFIPATAVSYAPYGNSVFLIEKKHDEKTGKDSLVLRQQFIRTGETRGDFVAVTED